jgi:hydrogenase maturation protease
MEMDTSSTAAPLERKRVGPRRVLVLGCGDPERHDDDLGRRVAEAVDRMDLPLVDVGSAREHTAEDAAAVADHDIVVFVEAEEACPDPFELRSIAPSSASSLSTHPPTPETLLSMAWKYLEARPEAFVLAIRGENFDASGTGLSQRAHRNLAATLPFIRDFLVERTAS